MKRYLPVVILLLLIAPIAASAQIDINWNDPVPVPRNTSFGCGVFRAIFSGCGPAGQGTFQGFIFSIINILLMMIGLISVLFVIVGGMRYAMAHGNDEQAEAAKKTILHAVIGLTIAILSFAIVRVIANILV